MSIMLIVLGHLEPGIYLMRFVYSFHLFIFFACSGFVGIRYSNRSTKEIVPGNLKRLLLPYMLWNIISQLTDIAVGTIDIGLAIRNILFMDASVGWNAALWFLVSIFWADTFCALVVKLNKWVQGLLVLLLIGCWIAIAHFSIVLPFGLYTVPAAGVFWFIGYWILDKYIWCE